MEQSEVIKDLAGALVKAQADMKGVKPDATNPHFRSKYASLGAIIGAVKPALTDHGLSFVQSVEQSESGLIVVTQLTHESGQWMRGSAYVPVDKNTAQGVGSATTYGRRYSLAALLGVADSDDDDGNDATEAKPAPKKKRPPKAKPPATPEELEKPTRPANQTEGGAGVTIGAGHPPEGKCAAEGDLWVDYSEDPALVLRADMDAGGGVLWEPLMKSDAPYKAAHKTVANMLVYEAGSRPKGYKIGIEGLLAMVSTEDGKEKPAPVFSAVSIGAIARTLRDLEKMPI